MLKTSPLQTRQPDLRLKWAESERKRSRELAMKVPPKREAPPLIAVSLDRPPQFTMTRTIAAKKASQRKTLSSCDKPFRSFAAALTL